MAADSSKKSTSALCLENSAFVASGLLPKLRFTVAYKGHSVGEYFADLLIEDAMVVELKCVKRLAGEHTAQCLNYLRASGVTLCLLVDFQKPKVEWKRIVHLFEIPEP